MLTQIFTVKMKIMNTFSNISVKTEVAKKFRTFSKSLAPTHSQALEIMISFFVENQISPKENCGPGFVRLEKNILNRINAVIAIIKDIEKNQTKPTLAMLQALFEHIEPKKVRPLMIEKKRWIFEKENPGKKYSDDFRVSAVVKSKS